MAAEAWLSCGCGGGFPLDSMYLCRTCNAVKCPRCVSEEIDSYYCPNCLENMPSSEASLYLNRCSKCFGCPSCSATLQVVTDAESRCYLQCGLCAWNSVQLDMVDTKPTSLIVDAIAAERETELAAEFARVQDLYSTAAHADAQDKERLRRLRRRSRLSTRSSSMSALPISNPPIPLPPPSLQTLDPTLESKEAERRIWKRYTVGDGISGSGNEERGLGAGMSRSMPAVSEDDGDDTHAASASTQTLAGESSDPMSSVPQRYGAPSELQCENSSLWQRYLQPATQPTMACDVRPIRKRLLTKRSKRCRACEHNLVKPELHPNSIKFKIRHILVSYAPLVRVVPPLPELATGSPSSVSVSFVNPLESVVGLTLCTSHAPALRRGRGSPRLHSASSSAANSPALGRRSLQSSQSDGSPASARRRLMSPALDELAAAAAGTADGLGYSPELEATVTASSHPPRDPTYIGAYNDLAILDEDSESEEDSEFITEDGAAILSRKGNRVVIAVPITPTNPECIVFSLGVTLSYMDGSEKKELRYTMYFSL